MKDTRNSAKEEKGEEHEQIRLVNTPEPAVKFTKMNEFTNPGHGHGVANMAAHQDTAINIGTGYKSKKVISTDAYANCIRQAAQSQKSQRFSKSIMDGITNFKCTPVHWIISIVPILSWLPKYNWKTDFTYDLIAGATISVMHIPQGMAYALLGNLQPVTGMYMAFFPIIVYSMLGTSRHVSMGTFAVICLMTGKVATERMTIYASQKLNLNESMLLAEMYVTDDGTDETRSPISAEQIATAISFAVGIWQVLMGILRLGSLSVLLSSELVSGFTTGAAVHVFTSQVKNLIGLQLPRRNGLFKIPLTYADIVLNFKTHNLTAIVLSIITLLFLIVYNEVLKPIAARKIPFPIPVELFTIVLGTLISRYWITTEEYKIPIVNHIPTGLPTPTLPPMEIIPDVIIDSLIIGIVAYTVSISMAKIFAAKHNYNVRPNQELLANGASNLVGSFFMCAPISASLSRSLIQEQVGGRTQIAGLFSCLLLVPVLLWIGPFFETLPHCVLSSMIIVALKGMFMQVFDLPKAYKESPLNALVWIASFVSTVLLDIEFGVLVGLCFSVFVLVWRSSRPHINVLGAYADSNVYADVNLVQECKEIPGIKIIKYTGSLNFATVEAFADKLQVLVPPKEPKGRKSSNNLGGIIVSTISKEKINDNISMDDNLCDYQPGMIVLQEMIPWIILDFSGVSSIDPAGVRRLKSLCKLYSKRESQILFAGCPPLTIEIMDRCELIKEIGISNFFQSVQDAINFCFVSGNGNSTYNDD